MKWLDVVVVVAVAVVAFSLTAVSGGPLGSLCCNNPGCGGCECRNTSHLVSNNTLGPDGAQNWHPSHPAFSSMSRNQSQTALVHCLLCKIYQCKFNVRNATSQ